MKEVLYFRSSININSKMSPKILEEVRKAGEVLKKGGIILYPTDTIWGIGCDATNAEAVKRIYEIKQREDSKSMLILLNDVGKMASYADIPDIAYELIEVADKPLTIIYPNAKGLAANLIGEDKTIGIRITNEEFSKALCHRFHRPIVSTSANISGEPSPPNFKSISEKIKEQVDYIVNVRQEENNSSSPSSIIKLEADGQIKIIRR